LTSDCRCRTEHEHDIVEEPGVSSGDAITTMESLAESTLPRSMGVEGTEITQLQALSRRTWPAPQAYASVAEPDRHRDA